MGVPVLDMLGLRHIFHPAGWACAGLVAAASFAVHGADVGRSVFFASIFTVFVLMVAATGSKAKGSNGQDGKDEFFHVSIFKTIKNQWLIGD